jgi:hypothetical protein
MAGKGKPRLLAPEEEQLVIQQFQAGTPATEIARAMSIPRHRVYACLKRVGLRPEDHQRYRGAPKPIPEGDEALVQRYRETRKLTATAQAFGLAYSTVRKRLLRYGIDVSERDDPAVIANVVARGKAGERRSQIAASLGLKFGKVDAVLRKHGIKPLWIHPRGESHGQWKGGRLNKPGGYVWIRLYPEHPYYGKMAMSHGYILEHRLVMAEALGRPLDASETVHHIDGNRANNVLSNLQLRNGNHGTGVVFQCRTCGGHDIEAVPLANRKRA